MFFSFKLGEHIKTSIKDLSRESTEICKNVDSILRRTNIIDIRTAEDTQSIARLSIAITGLNDKLELIINHNHEIISMLHQVPKNRNGKLVKVKPKRKKKVSSKKEHGKLTIDEMK